MIPRRHGPSPVSSIEHPLLELMLRAARPWPIERFVQGSLAAMGDAALTDLTYGLYCAKWLERHQDDAYAVGAYGLALVRVWRYHVAYKTGRWPKGSLACAPRYDRLIPRLAGTILDAATKERS